MLEYTRIPLGPLQTNCYVVHDGANALVIDPGGDPEPVLVFLRKNGLKLQDIYNTHLHFDHTSGNAALARACNVKIHASERDAYLQADTPENTFGFPAPAPYVIQNMDESDVPALGGVMRVLATPGHTPGGLSFYFPAMHTVFCGDTLFKRSIGRSDFPGGDGNVLESSIRTKLYTLPDDTRACCGHGPETLIGEEKSGNPFVRVVG